MEASLHKPVIDTQINTSKNKQKSSVTINDERLCALWLRECKCESGIYMRKGTNYNGQVGKKLKLNF